MKLQIQDLVPPGQQLYRTSNGRPGHSRASLLGLREIGALQSASRRRVTMQKLLDDLFDQLYASIPKDPKAKVQIYTAELAVGLPAGPVRTP